MVEKPIVFFRFGNDIFGYDITTSYVLSLNELTYEMLVKYNDNLEIKQISEHLYKQFNKNSVDKAVEALKILTTSKIISTQNCDENYKGENFVERSCNGITLVLTNKCNFNCTYCFEKGQHGKKDMDKETVKKAIDLLFSDNQNNKKAISFFGGEPLLKVDLIEFAIDYVKQKKRYDLTRFSITTNGSLFNSRIMKIIKQNNIHLMTSIDGKKEMHDKNRVTIDNRPTFDKIMSKFNMYPDLKSITTIKNTITKESAKEYFYFMNFCNENNLKLMTTIVSDERSGFTNEEDVDALIEQCERICSYFIDSIEQNKSIQLPPFLRSFASLYPDLRSKSYCPINEKLTVDTNGDIYTCHRFCGNDKFKVGAISDIQSLNFAEYTKNSSYCDDCWARNICLGGCIHENYIYSGDINESSHAICKLRKSWMGLTISVYGSLCKNSPDKMRSVIGESLYDKNTLRYIPLFNL